MTYMLCTLYNYIYYLCTFRQKRRRTSTAGIMARLTTRTVRSVPSPPSIYIIQEVRVLVSFLICSFFHLFVCSFVHLLIRLLFHYFIYAFLRLFICFLLICVFVFLSVRLLVRLFISSFIHLFVWPLVHLFICLLSSSLNSRPLLSSVS